MGSGPCNRCGRLPPNDDAPLNPALGEPHPAGGLRRPWASIEGTDVCPDCQTPVERREVGLRVVAAIEAEMERRRRDGIPPDALESALVNYAMSVRDGLEAPSDAGELTETQPAERPDTVPEQARRTRSRVAMTAAFLTGHPLAVRIAGYSELQSALAAALRGPGWRVHRLHTEGGTYDESGGGFVEALPLVIARRAGPELLSYLRDLLEDPSHTERAVLSRSAPAYDIRATGLSIDVYDLGVAVLTAWFDVLAPRDAEPPAVARTVKSLAWLRVRPGMDEPSPIAQALQEIARDTAERYGAAVRTAVPESIQSGWLSGPLVAAPSSTSVAKVDERGRLLWLHPVFVLEAPTPSEQIARQFAPAFHRIVDLWDGVFAPGVGSSVIVTAPGSTGAATPVLLTQLHWAYYALYMEIDRGLLAVLNQGRWSTSASLKLLERDAENAFSDYLRVMEARARLDSELTALGGAQLAVWQKIADVQRFDAVVEAVERKIDVLQRLTERRVDQAAADRARHIGRILGSLTVLTVLTVAIAVIGYFFGTIQAGGLRQTWLRVAAVAGACALAFFIWWVAFGERISQRRARRRQAP